MKVDFHLSALALFCDMLAKNKEALVSSAKRE
jgi:hypothetical protein